MKQFTLYGEIYTFRPLGAENKVKRGDVTSNIDLMLNVDSTNPEDEQQSSIC